MQERTLPSCGISNPGQAHMLGTRSFGSLAGVHIHMSFQPRSSEEKVKKHFICSTMLGMTFLKCLKEGKDDNKKAIFLLLRGMHLEPILRCISIALQLDICLGTCGLPCTAISLIISKVKCNLNSNLLFK